MRQPGNSASTAGFTLIELVLIILLLTVISVTVAVKWPTDMNSSAAKYEFIQAVRYAKNLAITREWSTAASAWGITVAGNKYYVGRADAGCQTDCSNSGCADEMMCNRYLLGDSGVTLASDYTILFNGLGEPIDASGTLQNSQTFTINGTQAITVCAQTGYVIEGASCP